MKVVFLEEVAGSGRIGEVKNVADGYARNYLLPRKLAMPATDHNVRLAQARADAEARRQAKTDAEAEVLAEKLVGKRITITVKAGPQGRLYGSVTGWDIAEEAEKLLGQPVEQRQVELEEPIREVGEFEVALRLSRNVCAMVQVAVVGEGAPPAEKQSPGAEKEEPASVQPEEPALSGVEGPPVSEQETVEAEEAEADPPTAGEQLEAAEEPSEE